MQKKYVVPVVGQIYKNQNGREYYCLSNAGYSSQSDMRVAVGLGEHQASMVRISDGWSFVAQGLQQYEDGTVEWNFSTGGAFREDDLDRCRKLLRANNPNMKKYFDYLDDLRDSGATNMFGAVPYLKSRFFELYVDEARAQEVLTAWMDSRSGR
jgi:hypothetical protein